MYIVMEFRKELSYELEDILGIPVSFGPTPLSWADGMIGAAPVFETREQAEAYAGKAEILHIDYVEDKP